MCVLARLVNAERSADPRFCRLFAFQGSTGVTPACRSSDLLWPQLSSRWEKHNRSADHLHEGAPLVCFDGVLCFALQSAMLGNGLVLQNLLHMQLAQQQLLHLKDKRLSSVRNL